MRKFILKFLDGHLKISIDLPFANFVRNSSTFRVLL
jgi:hypothetical protein